MSLVTRGLGKKVLAGATATLVSFGLGITTLGPIPVTPPGIIQPTAEFAHGGPIVTVTEGATRVVYHFNEYDISISGEFNTRLSPAVLEPLNISIPEILNNKINSDVEFPKIDIQNKTTVKYYYDEVIELEDEALLLDTPFTDIEYPKLTLNTYKDNTDIGIDVKGISIKYTTYREEQNKEEEELFLFDII